MHYDAIRKMLHEHPGISGDEHYAHDLIVNTLSDLHPDRVYDHVGGNGVIAVWGQQQSNPTIAIRGDIDALPIGHRCGHDGHAAILLQLASLINTQGIPSGINVILIFQPEEETGTGSQKILDAGILQQYNIRAIFGFHNLPGYPLGTVVLNRHTFAAASTGVIYRLTGRETHASTPEEGINPGLATADIIRRFQALNKNPFDDSDNFTQATLIRIDLGDEAFGTSAGQAYLMFTLRAYSNNTMSRLIESANNIVAETAKQYGLACEVGYRDPFNATENNSSWVEYIESCCMCRYQYNITPFRWSEDFANYLIQFPGAFFGIGAGEHHVELHHPDYDFPDALILPAAQVCFNLITDFLQTK